MRYKILRKYVPGGNVQDVTQQATATSQPAFMDPTGGIMSGYQVPTLNFSDVLPGFTVQQGVPRSALSPYAVDSGQNPVASQINLSPYAVDKNQFPTASQMNLSPYEAPRIEAASVPAPVSVEDTKSSVDRSQDGNVFDMMSTPYMALDLNSRAASLGRSIGRAGVAGQMWNDAQNRGERALAGTARGANIAQGIFSGISFGLGAARQIASAASEENARMKDLMDYRKNLRESRLNSMVRYDEGGRVHLTQGKDFDTSGLTGEYIYPLSKSMEDQANVEIEKGEYVLQPDIVAPQEAQGAKHSNGGTPVSLPDARIISDYRTAGDNFAAEVRRRFGIKANGKDTYATLLDKYKKKLGLKEKYEEQEKILKRLKKVEDISDKNTQRLNKSIISKYLSENQAEVDEMESAFRTFADVVYEAQESAKRHEAVEELFREGGPINKKQFRAFMKAGGYTEDKAKDLVYDAWIKKMEDAGPIKPNTPTKEQMVAFAKLAQDTFGRQLRFNLVNVPGYENILNPDSDINADQGLQHIKGIGYGNASVVESMDNLIAKTNRWANPLYRNGELKVRDFQNGYNQQLAFANALADSGLISNADAMRNFANNYGFYGEPGKLVPGFATNSRAVDNKYGQTTATRAFYSLDVLTPDQLKQLNDKGIKNFVDVWNNEDVAKGILGDDTFGKLQQLKNAEGFNGMDFILGAYDASKEPQKLIVPDEEVVIENPVIQDIPKPGAPEGEEATPAGGTDPRRPARPLSPYGYMFPEVLRPVSNGIVTPGLERAPRYRVDPVTESADQYINELNRQTEAQLNSLGEVPGQQRAAILANLNAIAGNQIGQYINNVNYRNANVRMQARDMNERGRVNAAMQDNNYRQAYQQQVLTAMSLADENRARYYDSVNNEIQTKWNTANSLNMIRTLAPNIRMMPNGQMIFVSNGEDTVTPGDYSTQVLLAMQNQNAMDRGAKPKVVTERRIR